MSLADRRAQALELTAAAGAGLLLCADPANVHWLTGVACEVETGPSPFAPGPLALVGADGPVRLIAAAEELPQQLPDGVVALPYEGFTTGRLRGGEHAAKLLADALEGRVPATDSPLARGVAADATRTGRAGRDAAALVDDAAARAAGPDLSTALLDARAIKDALALEQLRAALAVADAGQAALRAAVADGAAGATEIELFAPVRAAMEAAAGTRVPVLADLVAGPRTATGGGAPSARVVRHGELILCDLAPRVGGVWGDSCATVAAGEPPPAARAAHRRVLDALERAIDAVRPGAGLAAIDALARAGLDYPHHTGHGVGSSYHERPRLVPDAQGVLREGMVLALEPALYTDTFGIRLEHVVRVTADGCEDLSRHRLEL